MSISAGYESKGRRAYSASASGAAASKSGRRASANSSRDRPFNAAMACTSGPSRAYVRRKKPRAEASEVTVRVEFAGVDRTLSAAAKVLADEEAWARRIHENPSLIRSLAREAREEHRRGETRAVNELIG